MAFTSFVDEHWLKPEPHTSGPWTWGMSVVCRQDLGLDGIGDHLALGHRRFAAARADRMTWLSIAIGSSRSTQEERRDQRPEIFFGNARSSLHGRIHCHCRHPCCTLACQSKRVSKRVSSCLSAAKWMSLAAPPRCRETFLFASIIPVQYLRPESCILSFTSYRSLCSRTPAPRLPLTALVAVMDPFSHTHAR
jgi:hypothetical protein